MQPQVRTIGDTIQLTFTTVNLSGVPTALVGGAIGLLRGGATATETTGVSLAVDVGSVTGRNVVTIRTSEAGFKTGVDYAVVLTAGTVDSVNVRDRVGSFRLTALPLQSHLTPAQRLLDGRSVVGGIGDSYTSPVATWRCVADWDIAHSGPRMRMRGESLLMDGQNPFSTKGAAAQTGIRFDVAPGATFPGTAIVNRFAYSVASCWNGSLANGTAFTPGVFGNDIAANTGLYLNPNLLPIDIGAIDSWLSYIGGAHNVTSMRQLTRRDVSVGQVGSTAFNPTLQSGYASTHTTLTAMTGTGGAIDCVAQLQTTMTSKTWIQLGYGWVAKDQPLGIVYGPVWGFGGAATADFATAAGGLVTAWTDDQVHAWFAAAAASGYPIDILRVNLGINEFGLTPIADLYLQLLERWITIGQQYTKERFGILALTPAPWISNGTPKTDTTEFHRDEIAAAVDAFGDPLRVQLVDVHQAMRDLNGSVADWGPVYLQQTGSTYLHPTAAGGVAFGAAAYRALEDAASDLAPTVKRAVERLNLPTQTADATESRLIDDEDGQALLHNIYEAIAESLIASDPASQGIAAAVVAEINADAIQQTLQTRVQQTHSAVTDGTAGVAAQYLTLLGLGEGQTELAAAIAAFEAVDIEALAAQIAPLVLPTDVEGAHVPNSRTAELVRRGDKLYSVTPLPISAGESGPLFAASFAKDLAGGGGIYQVVSITVVAKPDDAGDEDLVVVGDFKRNGPEARFALAAAAAAALGRYTLAIAVVYAGGGGPATALVDVNVGSASS